jgi:hypothetical protein
MSEITSSLMTGSAPGPDHPASDEAAPLAIELRPGVVFPDWSAVTSETSRQALDAIFEVFGVAQGWTDYTTAEDRVRAAVLRSYGDRGRAPSVAELAADSGLPEVAVRDALGRLRGRDMVVLDGASGEVAGAYPFTERDTGHRVRLDGRTLNAMCAVDALGAGAMFGRDSVIQSSCRQCARKIAITTGEEGAALATVVPAETVVWTGIQYQDQAATTLCTVIAFFCSDAHLEAWHSENPGLKGYRMTVDEGMQTGKAIFTPFLAPAVEAD